MKKTGVHCIRWLVATTVGLAGSASAGDVLLELYTSQSCYSCPPAERLLAAEYLDRAGVLALEFHVDYWDDLVYGSAGQWKDPYSDPSYTERQRNYAAKFKKYSVFTPQMVVQGFVGYSGTDRQRIDSAIERAQEVDLAAGWKVSFAHGSAGWEVDLSPASEEDAEVFYVHFVEKASTSILRGENKGKTLLNHNIVVFVSQPQSVAGRPLLRLGQPAQGQDCAVIVQRPNTGVVLGAWRCPPTPA